MNLVIEKENKNIWLWNLVSFILFFMSTISIQFHFKSINHYRRSYMTFQLFFSVSSINVCFPAIHSSFYFISFCIFCLCISRSLVGLKDPDVHLCLSNSCYITVTFSLYLNASIRKLSKFSLCVCVTVFFHMAVQTVGGTVQTGQTDS